MTRIIASANTITQIRANRFRMAVLLSLLISALFFHGCTDGVEDPNDNNSPEPTPSQPYTVRIGSANQNLPGPGSLTLEFSDFLPLGDLNRAVDNNTQTKLITPHNVFYILWKGDRASLINHYYLVSASDSPESDPKSWTLSGSADGESWDVLDKQTDCIFSEREQKTEFLLDENTTAYTYYKLEVEANNGGVNTQIAEWAVGFRESNDKPYSIAVSGNDKLPSSGHLTTQYSDSPQGSDLSKLIDTYRSTDFITNHDKFYISWEGDEAKAVTIYYLVSGSSDNRETDPASWVLYASNDASSWTELDSRTGEEFSSRKEMKWFILENTEPYTFYKIEFEGNNGGSSTAISEFGLCDFDLDIDAILAKGAIYMSEGAHTEMGLDFNFFKDSGKTTTEEERAWLNDPSKEPEGINQLPFDVDLYPYGRPMPADANQRGIGDCCAVAALGSLAYSYPNFIKNIITDNGDNTYTLKMFDPNRERIDVTVSNRFMANEPTYIIAVAGKSGPQATWATVMEKALMKYRQIYYGSPNLGGIPANQACAPFTGCGIGLAYNMNWNAGPNYMKPEEWGRLVRVALIKGYFFVGGFWNNAVPLTNGISRTAHAYSLMHSPDKSALFIMRNPWGTDTNPSLDGAVTLYGNDVYDSSVNYGLFYPGEAAKYDQGVLDGYSYPYDL